MAFPYITEENFESGTRGHFDSEVDTENRLDIAHYSDLARLPASIVGPAAPYRGAYCVRVKLENDGTPANAYLQETGSWDLAASGTIVIRLAFYLSPNTVMANGDEFAIWQLWSSTNTVEAGAYINYSTASGFRFGVGETAATQFLPLELGKWHIFEVTATIDSGAGNDGSLFSSLDGVGLGAVTGLDQGAITSGVIGVLGQDAGTTAGLLLIDWVIADDGFAIGMPLARFPNPVNLTKSGHVFVGPGEIDYAAVVGGESDGALELYDTDTAIPVTGSPNSFVALIQQGMQGELFGPLRFERGCYALLSGTNPRAQVRPARTPRGPRYYGDEGAIRDWGIQRR